MYYIATIEIVSDSYPLNSNISNIACSFEVKALHGAKVVMTPVEVELEGGCFDNSLNIMTETDSSSALAYPGLSAQCGQSDLPAATHPVSSEGAVWLSHHRTSSEGRTRFKIRFQASQPESCPNDVTPDLCPHGPCCQGEDCCVLHAGVQPRGDFNILLNIFFEIFDI